MSKVKLTGGSVVTAPTPKMFTEDDAKWMRVMDFTEAQIETERERREKVK